VTLVAIGVPTEVACEWQDRDCAVRIWFRCHQLWLFWNTKLGVTGGWAQILPVVADSSRNQPMWQSAPWSAMGGFDAV